MRAKFPTHDYQSSKGLIQCYKARPRAWQDERFASAVVVESDEKSTICSPHITEVRRVLTSNRATSLCAFLWLLLEPRLVVLLYQRRTMLLKVAVTAVWGVYLAVCH